MYFPGALLLWGALILGLASTVAYGLAVRAPEPWLRRARQTYVLMTVAVVLASGLLMYLFVSHDYRFAYVWAYSDNALPMHFVVSSFWAGQEGSFLLWVLCGALFGLPLYALSRGYESRTMLFYNTTLLALLILLIKQSPFRFHEGLTQGTVPLDGQGLNPLLQNPWMVIHPPMMFVGYASLAIPFAFALAALWMRRYDEWTRVSLPWVLVSLSTLGTAIMMGGYWAYETLGWGGYWGWDPVENASLVPWLATAALTHGMLLQRGRNRFRRLNLILAIGAFLLVLYATFLTRSGVLSDFSVHSFVDLGLSGWLVLIMLVFLVLSLGLLAWRWREIPTEVGSEGFFSRTIFLVLGIVLLILIGLIVVLGTSAPLISRLWGEPSQVGPAFYNRMGFWLAVVFSGLLGVAPFLGWRRVQDRGLVRFGISLVLAAVLLGIGVALGLRGPLALVYAFAALLCIVANTWATFDRVRGGRLRAAGGTLAHVGMGLMILAFLTTGWFDQMQKVTLRQGEATKVLDYTMRFQGIDKPTATAREAMVVDVTATGGDSFVLRPRMWVNPKSNQLVANPDIRSTLARDLYLAPVQYSPGEGPPVSARLTLTRGQPVSQGEWTLTFQRFDLSQQNTSPRMMTVGVVVDVKRGEDAPITLMPTFLFGSEGGRGVPVSLPGSDHGQLKVARLNVDQGVVWVELLGVGGGLARTALLGKGESLAYRDLDITFRDFDLSGFEPDAGHVDFGVIFDVTVGGEAIEVVPRFEGTDQGAAVRPVEIPGTAGIALSVGRIDAERGAVQVQVFDDAAEPPPAEPAAFVVDVSVKPLVSLVWLGTIITIIGVVMALGRRGRDVAAIADAEPGGGG
jgi:cytochrome c-type biogenesis protein CcmF